MQSFNFFFPEISAKIFSWKLTYIHCAKVYTKNVLSIEVFINPCPAQNAVSQASHWSALRIGCVKYCSRLYDWPIWTTLSSSKFQKNFGLTQFNRIFYSYELYFSGPWNQLAWSNPHCRNTLWRSKVGSILFYNMNST